MIGGVSGSSSMEQMQQMQAARHKERFSNADVNGDSSIDVDEFLAVHENDERSKELFSKIDSDGDGGLTDTEMKDFAKEMQSNMQKMMSESAGKMGGMRKSGGPPPQKGGGKPGGENSGDATSVNGAQLMKMLEAYKTDEDSEDSLDSTEVTDADLLDEYLKVLEENEEENEQEIFQSTESLELTI